MPRGWIVRLKALIRREDVEAEFDEELRYHRDLEVERNLARGMAPDEARRAALRAIGDPTRLKEEARETWRWRWLDEVLEDARYTNRSLRKSWGFTVVAVLSLGCGVGATTTVFSVIDALDFRPVPFPDADRLVWLTQVSPDQVDGCPTCTEYGTGLRAATGWQMRVGSYDALAVQGYAGSLVLRDGNTIEYLDVQVASPRLFQLLGVRPLLGRTFVPEDTLGGAEPVVLLSYQDWKTRFGSDPEVVGRRLQYFEDSDDTDPRSLTVVGVLPEGFNLGPEPTLWRPYSSEEGMGRSRLFVNVGRLKPGVARSAAAAEFRAVGAQLARENPDMYERWRFEVRPLRDLLGRYQGVGRTTFFGMTVLVLLVAILNVSGLVLARVRSRRGELSVRSALGASRMRLVRQLLVEGIVLGLGGGVCAAMLSVAGVHAARSWFRMQQADLPLQIDHRVLGFLLGLSVLAGILTASLPALRSGSTDVGGALRDRPGSALGGRGGPGAGVLLAVQMACALILVSGAALLGSDFLKVRYLDLGFIPKGLQRVSLSADADFDGAPDVWRAVAERVRDRVAGTPGVLGAALERSLGGEVREVRTDRNPDTPQRPRPYTEIYAVDPSYFGTLGTPLLAGRGFASSDDAGAPPVAIVNAAAAASFWPGARALGHRILVGDSAGGMWLTVVGVTEDVEMVTGYVERHTPVVYRPFAQVPLPRPSATLYVRLERGIPGASAAAQASAREALGRPTSWGSVEETFSNILEKQRHDTIAVSVLAAFALLLAAMGVYGSVAYFVSSRTREIGIRMALGARARSILALVGGQSAVLMVGGVALGLGGALLLARVLGAFAWRTGGELNPWLLAASAGLMVLVVAVATYLPARRAVRIEPVVALRAE